MNQRFPYVSKNTLLGIAGLVWLAAGFNIMRIGLLEKATIGLILAVCLGVLVFAAFYFLIFAKMVTKHTQRIKDYSGEKVLFLHFFDSKSYAIMAFMMTGGISIRHFHLMPPTFIAVFYTGLGVALMTAGAKFLLKFLRMHCVSTRGALSSDIR